MFATSHKMQDTSISSVTSCGSIPIVISFRKGFYLTRLLNAPLSHFPSKPSSLPCGSWRIFRGRWLQVAPATTSRNPLSLPRQPSPSSSHPLLSPEEIQFERARTSLKEGWKGAGFCGARRRGKESQSRREKKRWCAFWWLYLMARARTCQMRIWPWLKTNSLSLFFYLFLSLPLALVPSLISDKTIRDVIMTIRVAQQKKDPICTAIITGIAKIKSYYIDEVNVK